jgi:hypothetical protein
MNVSMEELMIPMRELTDKELDAVCGGRRITQINVAKNTAVVVRSSHIYISQSIDQSNNNDD